MIDNDFRNYIWKDLDLKCALFDNPSFDNSIIGITDDAKIVYSYQKMINELAKDDNINEEEAREFIDYNTMRTLDYIENDIKPIVIHEITREDI